MIFESLLYSLRVELRYNSLDQVYYNISCEQNIDKTCMIVTKRKKVNCNEIFCYNNLHFVAINFNRNKS